MGSIYGICVRYRERLRSRDVFLKNVEEFASILKLMHCRELITFPCKEIGHANSSIYFF